MPAFVSLLLAVLAGLAPTAADPADLVVTAVDGQTLQGTFYGSPIENGRVNDAWDTVHLAFTTSDGSGTYHQTARLVGDRLEGTSHSLGRGFLLPWHAERAGE